MRGRSAQFVAVLFTVGLAASPGCAPVVVNTLQDCPSDAATLESMNAATYAVALKVRTGPGENDIGFSTLGTAFAIGPRLLATNAHVTEFFNGLTGLNVEEVVAVQSGTGTVITLLRALTHPEYNGNPLASPDVGLFTTQEVLPSTLTLASLGELETMRLGDPVFITGFPGDVNEFITVIPGVTVPQATSLSGSITAFRAHDPTLVVTPENTDVIQHQAPTTPGTSGSAMVRCGKIVAANNAGTVQLVLVVGQDGQIREERAAAASNNFGVHGKYLHEMISLFDSQALQGFELPPPFIPQGGGGGGQGVAAFAGNYQGGLQTPANAAHTIAITIAQNGQVSGTSTWANTGNFTLTGTIDANGVLSMADDAPERIAGFNRGIYAGQANAETGQITGTYAEGDANNVFGNWTAAR